MSRPQFAEVLYRVANAANLKFRQVNYNIAVSRIERATNDAITVVDLIPISVKLPMKMERGWPVLM